MSPPSAELTTVQQACLRRLEALAIGSWIRAGNESSRLRADAARACGRVFAAVMAGGQKARGKRAIDLLIAATAASAALRLYTRNSKDFSGLKGVVDVIRFGREHDGFAI